MRQVKGGPAAELYLRVEGQKNSFETALIRGQSSERPDDDRVLTCDRANHVGGFPSNQSPPENGGAARPRSRSLTRRLVPAHESEPLEQLAASGTPGLRGCPTFQRVFPRCVRHARPCPSEARHPEVVACRRQTSTCVTSQPAPPTKEAAAVLPCSPTERVANKAPNHLLVVFLFRRLSSRREYPQQHSAPPRIAK